jgi:hypothetical protein
MKDAAAKRGAGKWVMVAGYAAVFLVFPDMLIDALVTDKGDAILRQTAADLIGTPLLSRQFFLDQLHQVRRHFAWLVRGLLAPLRGLLVRLLEAIAARPGVTTKLSADRRRIHANLPRDVGLRVAALQERINLAGLSPLNFSPSVSTA